LTALISAFSLNGATVFDTNVIINPGAEAGAASGSGNDILPIPGWTTTGNFTVVAYGAPDFPTLDSPGSTNRGNAFFSGGPGNAFSSALQIIDMTDIASTVDAGLVSSTASGFFGGFSTQNDQSTLFVDFLDGSGTTLSGFSIGGVTNGDRGNVSGFLERTGDLAVPAGARQVSLRLESVRSAGSYNDGYADDLSLVLSTATEPIPEPSTWALLLAGTAALVLKRFFA
jgi:hypothetical protein